MMSSCNGSTLQAASVDDGMQLRDKVAGTLQHNGSASVEVPFDNTVLLMCLAEILPLYSSGMINALAEAGVGPLHQP